MTDKTEGDEPVDMDEVSKSPEVLDEAEIDEDDEDDDDEDDDDDSEDVDII